MRRLFFLGLALGMGCNDVLGIDDGFLRPDDQAPPINDGSNGGGPGATSSSSGAPADPGGNSGSGGVIVPGCGSSPGVSIPADCTLGVRAIASKDEAQTGPSLATISSPARWAIVWKSGANIRYNVVGEVGDAQLATDARVFEVDSAFESTPRIGHVGGDSDLAVAAGKLDSLNGNAYPAVERIRPDGVRVQYKAGPSLSVNTKPPRVGGLVSNGQSYFAIAVRDDATIDPSPARTVSFNAGMNGFHHSRTSIVATAIGFAGLAGQYGGVFVEGAGKAWLDLLDQNGVGSQSNSYIFTDTSDRIDTSQPDPIAIAGVKSQFAIAWVDPRSTMTIALKLAVAYDGSYSKTVVVSDSSGGGGAAMTIKHRPQVIFDGKATIGVAWLEESPQSNVSHLMFRRFALDLTPIDPKPAILETTDIDVTTSFGFANGPAQNSWSFAYLGSTSRHQIIRRLSCTK